MSRPAAGLGRTQRWFLGRVEGSSPRGAARAADLVLPSATLTAEERMDVYSGMYLARLEECLRNDFPVVVALLGPERFSAVARDFVAAHPPSSWTLNDLGLRFPAFLAARRGLPRAALVRDVARLERAMAEAFDAADAARLTPAEVARVPADAWETARLEPAPSLRVLALRTQADRAVVSVREHDRRPGRLPRGPSWLAVYRKDLRVWRLGLSRPMHAALSALVDGRTLGAALRAAERADARSAEGDPATLPDRVRRAFATWIDEGLFASVAVR